MNLHVTNGDAAAALLRAGGCQGKILPWRDVLHMGPVSEKSLEALSEVRAAFLADIGWGTREELRAAFAARDRTLRQFRRYDGVVLWFEHDLYDQLQLAQVLDFLGREALTTRGIALICIDRHESVRRFRGLGDLRPEHVGPLYRSRGEVDSVVFGTASAVWDAYTRAHPMGVQRYVARNSAALPFMRKALQRHLQEFPSSFNGLGRTAHHALYMIASGCSSPVDLLKAHWKQEEAPFMGDWAYWHEIEMLAKEPAPLITIRGAHDGRDLRFTTLSTTEDGQRVLAGQVDAVRLRGIDRWYGGVHQKGGYARWRWDNARERMVED